VWHRKLYCIDHGAALYFHHNWQTMAEKIESPFPQIAQHILLPWASEIEQASIHARRALTPTTFAEILEQLPDEWLEVGPIHHDAGPNAAEKRAAYLDFFVRRLAGSSIFEQEAMRAHANLV
jgi:hypothetical protein